MKTKINDERKESSKFHYVGLAAMYIAGLFMVCLQLRSLFFGA